MTGSGLDWTHAGISEVKDWDSYKVRIPDHLFDPEDDQPPILTLGVPIFWSYETVTGVVVVSSQQLQDEAYSYHDTTKFGGDSNYRASIPKGFMETHPGQGEPEIETDLPEKARLTGSDRLHFMYHSEMRTRTPTSCYVFTEAEFSDRFADSGIWNGRLDNVPKFS